MESCEFEMITVLLVQLSSQDHTVKKLTLLSLICLTLAAALASVSPAFADQHKDNMERRCKSTGGGC